MSAEVLAAPAVTAAPPTPSTTSAPPAADAVAAAAHVEVAGDEPAAVVSAATTTTATTTASQQPETAAATDNEHKQPAGSPPATADHNSVVATPPTIETPAEIVSEPAAAAADAVHEQLPAPEHAADGKVAAETADGDAGVTQTIGHISKATSDSEDLAESESGAGTIVSVMMLCYVCLRECGQQRNVCDFTFCVCARCTILQFFLHA